MNVVVPEAAWEGILTKWEPDLIWAHLIDNQELDSLVGYLEALSAGKTDFKEAIQKLPFKTNPLTNSGRDDKEVPSALGIAVHFASVLQFASHPALEDRD